MARRQATAKTATPGDNSSPPAELKGEEAPSASDLAIQAARKEDTQNGSHGDQGTTPKKVCEQDAIPAGDHVGGKQDASVLKSSLVKCALETPHPSTGEPMDTGESHNQDPVGKPSSAADSSKPNTSTDPSEAQGKEKGNRPPQINLTSSKSADSGLSEDAADGSSTTPGIPLSSTVPGKSPSAIAVLPKEVSPVPMDTGTTTGTKESTSSQPKNTDVSPSMAPKGGSKGNASPSTKPPFLCSCGRSFDTRRGLSIHLAHEPKHFQRTENKASNLPAKEADAQDSQSAPSSPSQRDPSPAPHSPSSTPNSPTHYSMASFKPSPRNPQYYSIIRTRRSNASEGGTAQQEAGTKRARSSTTPVVGASPAKVMHLSGGEKFPVEDSSGSSEASGKKKAKDVAKDAGSGAKEGRVHSVSGSSDASSPPSAVLSKSLLGSSVMQEFNLRSSPITRSNAASMKTHVEFISLPSHRKRGGKRGGLRGGWKGGSQGDGTKLNISSEDNASEVGEDFDVSAEMKSEEEKVDEKNCSQDSDKMVSSDTEKVQPPKRKRGRPPKIRKDTPTSSPAASGAATKSGSSPSLSAPLPSHGSPGPISSSTRSSKSHGRGTGKGSAGTKTDAADESPLPTKADPVSKVSGKTKAAESLDKGTKSHDKGSQDKIPEDAEQPATEVLLPATSGKTSARRGGKGTGPPPPSPVLTSPTAKDHPAGTPGNKKLSTNTRSHSKRAVTEQGDGESTTTTTTTSRKKAGGKVSKTTSKDSSDVDRQSVSSTKSNERKNSVSDTVSSKDQSRSESTSSPVKELRNKTSKSKKTTPKSRTPSKSDRGDKKSVSDTGDEAASDVAAGSARKAEEETEEKGDVEEPAPPTAQIALTEQRQSVFVSVLSGSDKKESAAAPVTADEQVASVSESSSKEGGGAPEAASLPHKEPQRRVSETSPAFPYPSSSAPTPTYPQFPPYHPSFPPPHHMMYPPSAPPSTMYPFYGYPATGHLQMGHPGHGPYYPHMAPPTVPPITTGDQIHVPQNMHPQSPYGQSLPALSPNGSTSCSAPSSSAVLPPTITSTATTVGGVRVSVLDKPPTQLPMVTLPYPLPSAATPRPMRPQPGGYPMEIPSPSGMRAYMGGGGAHSPDGLEPRHLHPLSQVYRPGMIGPYPPTHLPIPHHPSYHQAMPVRLDPSGIYMDWPEPRVPPSEEHPVQPVECPECGRVFKNNKALNGHMRLHGGFDWTKKQPFTNTDQAKQQSSNGSSSGSATHTKDAAGKDSEENKSKPGAPSTSASTSSSKSVRSKKRSRSNSRSRSRSKSPGASVVKTNKSKRRKSSEDSAHHQQSNLLKEARSKDKEKAAPGTLPIPRAPTIFTFDPNSAQPHHKPLCPSTTSATAAAAATGNSSSSTTPSSEGHDNGGNGLTHSGSTLDDLCRAAAELERMDTSGVPEGKGKAAANRGSQQEQQDAEDPSRKRPGNISIPQTQTPSPAIDRERHRLGATPPYTPPPILSPSRSLLHLAPGVVSSSQGPSAPCTPNRILQHWGNYPRKVSETDQDSSFSEPRINIGDEFQAKLPACNESRNGVEKEDPKATLLWKPLEGITEEDESVIDGYMELACSPAVLYGGRNKELASHYLHALGGSIKEAVRWLVSGRSLFDSSNSNSESAGYNYSGSNRWSGRERQQFRRAWKVHRKQFNMLRSTVESKKFSDVIEYYYTWKKYCSDEYRGRNRHISEEIFSDEDDIAYPQVPSSSSSGSGESEQSNENGEKSQPKSNRSKKSSERPTTSSERPTTSSAAPPPIPSAHPAPTKIQQVMSNPQNRMFNNNLPIVYAPHSSPTSFGQQVHQFPCKFPGCNQIFTSIFALNGHIRIHGGSFFPKSANGAPLRQDALSGLSSSIGQASFSSSPSSSAAASSSSFPSASRLPHSSSASSGLHYSSTHKPYLHHNKSFGDLELAKALLELPGSHSIAKGLNYHTPSPKPSPGKGKSLVAPKKKLSSSSPGEHEGYYPCNRCGRVFTKVKSRSAHMKSHVVKSN